MTKHGATRAIVPGAPLPENKVTSAAQRLFIIFLLSGLMFSPPVNFGQLRSKDVHLIITTTIATDAVIHETSTSIMPLPLSSLNPRDVAATDLGRVLSRLENKILSVDTADPRLRHSSYERTKTSAVILPRLPFLIYFCPDGDDEADPSQIRISNTLALSSSVWSILPHLSNSPPKKPRPSPPSRLSAP